MSFCELEGLQLHQSAALGKLEQIRQVLSKTKDKINQYCPKGLTPLHYAAKTHQSNVVEYLLDVGADPLLTDNRYFHNLVQMAKIDNQHTPLSLYIKQRIGLDEEYLLKIATAFEKLIKKEIATAKWNQKKILILLGEDHGQYHIYQVEKAFLEIALSYNIQTLYSESNIHGSHFSAIDHFAMKTLNMQVEGIDTHPYRIDDNQIATMAERNFYIANEINRKNKEALFIVGCQHLYGLLEDKQSKIDTTKFHIVPINLSRLYSPFPDEEWMESQYAYDSTKVIQIEGTAFSCY